MDENRQLSARDRESEKAEGGEHGSLKLVCFEAIFRPAPFGTTNGATGLNASACHVEVEEFS